MEQFSAFIIEGLVNILDSRFLYQDADPLVDSKFTKYVVSFYKNCFDKVNSHELYASYLKKFIHSVFTKDLLLTNSIGLLEVFAHLSKPVTVIDRDLFVIMIQFAKREGLKLHIGKQVRFYNYILIIFGNYTNIPEVTVYKVIKTNTF